MDGGPNLDSKAILSFLRAWGITRRLSSAYYSQSNGRAEAAVKIAKRIITSHTGSKGNIYTEINGQSIIAISQYTNKKELTPLLHS